ncbi:hypothetical protein COP05_05830 [Dermabacter jinjuensis]|uniref:Integrase catalytic domain-containing protein n=1 Tax=Dermabacter jinjuensis TaxID=1667168 RepID=A0ABN5DN51_9MICO|nr:hypothetical protein COP05_05830 [Dermabacter jinjuensis]
MPVGEPTYVHTSCGFSYVAFVPDVFTREILAYVVDTRATKSLVIRVLRQALALRQLQDPYFESAGMIHHSDAVSQYTSTNLRRLLAVHQMDGSIGTVSDAYDNGLMESTIALCKSELIDFEAGRGRTGVRWNAPQSDGSTGIITSGCIPRSGISHRSSTTPTTNEKTTQAFTPLSKIQADSERRLSMRMRLARQTLEFVFATARTGNIPDPAVSPGQVNAHIPMRDTGKCVHILSATAPHAD